ncbi:GTP cyclohydrolase II [Methyloceanibacter stevinii]|nr:GTP cyclohydrolase II [Methyloceanibacter stevinii]
MMKDHFCSVADAVDDLQRGRMVVLIDDPDRENEGDLVMLAEHATPEAISFMATQGRGLICLPLLEDDCDRLGLELQPKRHSNAFGTGFTIPIDAADAPGPGISAQARAHTVRRAADPEASSVDFNRPGHIFPLRAKSGGVLVRPGHTEAIVDFAKLAGARPAGVICEIMNDNGTMARTPDLHRFARKFDLKVCTIESLVAYRQQTERLFEPIELNIPMPTRYGTFMLHLFRSILDGSEHLALTRGIPGPTVMGTSPVQKPILVRLHSECMTGDVFHSLRCDCGEQRDAALERIAAADCGVLLYMRQEGRGIGLANKLAAYRLQDEGLDTVEANLHLGFPADKRDYTISAQILKFLGLQRIRLLTNNPRKVHALKADGLQVVENVPLRIEPNAANQRYLETKRDKLGHQLPHLNAMSGEMDGTQSTR